MKVQFCIFFFFLIYFCCTGSSLLRRLFSSYSEQGLLSSCNTQASHCGGLSCGVQALVSVAFSSCGEWAQ